MRRVIGIDIHRTFAEVVFWQDGRLRWHGRVDMTRAGLRQRDGGGPCAALQLARRRRRRPESHGSACSMHPKRRVCGRFATSRTWPSELERRYGAPGPKSEVEQRIEGEDVDGVSDQSQLRLASSRPQVLSVRWRRTLKPRRITAPAASACDGSRPQMVLQRQPPHTGPRRGIVQERPLRAALAFELDQIGTAEAGERIDERGLRDVAAVHSVRGRSSRQVGQRHPPDARADGLGMGDDAERFGVAPQERDRRRVRLVGMDGRAREVTPRGEREPADMGADIEYTARRGAVLVGDDLRPRLRSPRPAREPEPFRRTNGNRSAAPGRARADQATRSSITDLQRPLCRRGAAVHTLKFCRCPTYARRRGRPPSAARAAEVRWRCRSAVRRPHRAYLQPPHAGRRDARPSAAGSRGARAAQAPARRSSGARKATASNYRRGLPAADLRRLERRAEQSAPTAKNRASGVVTVGRWCRGKLQVR